MSLEIPSEIIQLNKIFFLVHPGFLRDADTFMFSVENDLRLGREMSLKYLEQIKGLGDDECVLLFTHKQKGEFREDLKFDDEYATFIRKLKQKLGDRLVVFTETLRPQKWKRFPEKLRAILKARGYEFSPQVQTFAFGEYMDACVPQYAQAANKAMQLAGKTGVLVEKSAYYPGENPDELIRKIRNKYSQIDFLR